MNTMDQTKLGIGTRLQHTLHGPGVIVAVKYASYLRLWGGITEIVPLGDRWQHGMILLQPADKTLKPKEIPIEDFFHKIIMLRDRMRVLEQNINSSKTLSNEEKVNLQQYITRCYGSLTTFNVLFRNKEQWFVGEKSKD